MVLKVTSVRELTDIHMEDHTEAEKLSFFQQNIDDLQELCAALADTPFIEDNDYHQLAVNISALETRLSLLHKAQKLDREQWETGRVYKYLSPKSLL